MNAKEPKISERAVHFKEIRSIRNYEIAEDYTELIYDLIEKFGEVRNCDIAREMGISHVSVLKTIKRLVRDGFLNQSSQVISLTPKGKNMAIFSKKKHLVLSQFLLKLGVPEHIAATDVEGMEHHISNTTLEAIEAHMQKFLLPNIHDRDPNVL